ncbi:MAG: DUF488 domain-containing protein [Gammaproteobacteria bacterium]
MLLDTVTTMQGDLMIYTIGHSNHMIERFLDLLSFHQITVLADVRSTPYSRRNPQFNREKLKQALAEREIGYVALGEELGARSKDRACYRDGKVVYARLAATPLFREGLRRLKSEASEHRVAIMCAEKEPLDCHRTILVARWLVAEGVAVGHILATGALETHAEVMARLRRRVKVSGSDMFRSEGEIDDAAYELQEERIAYTEPSQPDSRAEATDP